MVLVSNRKKKCCMVLLSFVLRELRFNLFPFIISYNFTIKAVKDEV